MESKRTILIVDDAPLFRELESLFLARSGRVVTAASGPEALEAARRERPDLMLVDAFMPGMDGAALCRAVKGDPALAAIPVVILTSSDAGEDRAAALRAGASDVLSKPVSRMELIEAVQRFLRYRHVRGLPRAPFRAPVHVDDGHTDWMGTARNVSRGGIFVEGGKEVAPHSEVTLQFDLPESGIHVRPSAEVVWIERGESAGMGLRFLGLDGKSARLLDHWVHERASLGPVPVRAAQ